MRRFATCLLLFLTIHSLTFGQDCGSLKDCFMDAYQIEDFEKRASEMLAILERAKTESANDSVQAYMNTAIGMAYFDMKKYDQAEPYLNLGIEQDPSEALLAYLTLGNIELYSKRNYPEAIRYHSKVIELNEKNVWGWYYRGLANYYNRKDQQAYDDLSRAQKLIPVFKYQVINGDTIFSMQAGDTSVPKTIRSEIHYHKGYIGTLLNPQDNSVVDDFTLAIKDNPNNAGAFRERGIFYYYKKRNQEALNDLSRSVNLDDKKKSTWYYLGLTYYDLKDYARAANCLAEARKLDPNYYRAIYWEAYSVWYYSMDHKDQWADLSKRIINDFKIVANQTQDAKLAAQARDGLKQLGQ